MDWERELVIACLVKQKIKEVDIEELWEYTLPEVAASPDQVKSLEELLRFRLNSEYRDYLLHANGWRSFMQNVDLFGVDDLRNGSRFSRAVDLMRSLEPVDALCGIRSSDLFPFAVSSDDIDVMLMAKPDTVTPGKIVWIAGSMVETFSGFDEWFLAMVDFNRMEYRRLLAKNG